MVDCQEMLAIISDGGLVNEAMAQMKVDMSSTRRITMDRIAVPPFASEGLGPHV